MSKVPADIKREYDRVYYAANRERILERKRVRYAMNRGRILEQWHEKQAKNMERLLDKFNLKPCPFCNGKLLYLLHRANGYKVICRTCGAMGGMDEVIDDAVEAWNERGVCVFCDGELRIVKEQVGWKDRYFLRCRRCGRLLLSYNTQEEAEAALEQESAR